jgi:hypothetical protein
MLRPSYPLGCSDFKTRDEKCKYDALHTISPAHCYVLLGPNIFLSMLFSNVLSVIGQDLHAYKTKGKIIDLCWYDFSVCVFKYQMGIPRIVSDIRFLVTECHFHYLVSFLNICTCIMVLIC